MSAITASVTNKFWLFVFDILLLLLFFVDVSFVVDYALVPNFFLLVHPRDENENCNEKPCHNHCKRYKQILTFCLSHICCCCFVVLLLLLLLFCYFEYKSIHNLFYMARMTTFFRPGVVAQW